ncbi:MAG: hypothetical protein LBO21_04320 [Synergistaceae bacterium]|jgi:hypothetical protein|nr:hypothetical protein [Synergistaceae bacterium]
MTTVNKRASSRAFQILCALLLFVMTASRAVAGSQDEAIEILDRWTSFRWGDGNLAWIVHYPDELVDPWVNAESEKRRMRPDQAEEFRRMFVNELRIGSATPVMLSIHSYGDPPPNLSPLSKNIVLIDSSGKRVSPIVIDKKLDGQISGLVQGFIFFPKQENENFSIGLRGLVPNKETVFSFDSGAINTTPQIETHDTRPASDDRREVVVKIPTTKHEPPPVQSKDEREFAADSEVYQPTAPVVSEPAPTGDARDETDEVPESGDLIPPAVLEGDVTPIEPLHGNKQVLESFLRAWIAGDTGKMYSMLSSASRDKISLELFERDVMSGGFRSALKSGYKVNWVGDNARVTVARKVLFLRIMDTKRINFVAEDGAARIDW